MVSSNKREKIERVFEEAFNEFADSIFRYCYLRINNRERSKELTQEVFFKAFEYALKGREIKNIKPFLYKVAHNLLLNEYRDRKQTESLETLNEEVGFDPESSEKSPEEMALIQEVMSLLDKLEEEDKEIMVMRYVEDLPVKEIAEIMNQSENVISVKIHRNIKVLKEYIK